MLYNADKPLTLAEIQADPAIALQLVNLAKRRYWVSADAVRPWHEKWVRFYKIYRSIVDAVDDADEANYMISYAFGIVEDLVSKIAEPILQLKPPCRVAAKMVGHEQQADNFSSIASNYFQSSRYQLEKTEGIREMIITGNSWEMDGWAADYANGRMWAKVPSVTVVDKIKSILTGKIFNTPTAAPYNETREIPYQIPLKCGYFTRFPWAFDVYPEPGVRNVRDMHWLLEQERSVAVEDLSRRTFMDPQTMQRVGLFDFTQLLKDIGAHEPGSIRPIPIDMKHDYGKEAQDAMAGMETERSQWSQLDMDRVSLLWVWEPNRMYAIANGQYIVAYRENIFQVPRIPYRLNVYTPQKEFLFGLGALEPVESQLYELADIHKLSMRNWVRIINRMVAYNEDAIPYIDDFKPRAGGKVRVRVGLGGNIASEIMPIEQPDVTQSMLAMESNTKGLMERVISLADYSPGVDGTKQTHKTLGGLMEISKNLAQRTTTVRRMLLSNYQDQMWFMEKLYSQFMLDKTPFTVYGPDGSTRLSQFDLWDIHTNGTGFDFIIEYDPSFGDDALLRNQMMVLLDTGLKYENARMMMQRKDLPQIDLGDIMRRMFKAFGWSDTSNILKMASGELDPQAEFNMMLSGQPVAPQAGEDLIKHLIEHSIQKQSPKLKQGIADGSVDPKVMAMLQAHIQATELLIMQVMKNPDAIAQQHVMQAIAASSGMPQGGQLPGQAGGNPQLSAGSLNGSATGMGLTVPNSRTPTPRDSGMTERV